jgi:uncharacterized protein (TIGR02391 family)
MVDERLWYELSAEELIALPVDELALLMLRFFGGGSRVRFEVMADVRNRLEGASVENRVAAERAATEAWHWLVRKGLMMPDPTKPDSDFRWLRSDLGIRVAEDERGLELLAAEERIDLELHERIADDVRSEFLRFKFEAAVWAAMREVEIALREKSGADDKHYGQPLVNHAFGKDGTLIDSASGDAEEQAIGNLFRGAIGAFKNPPSHRRVELDDPTEAAEIVTLASLLLRILDRLERR